MKRLVYVLLFCFAAFLPVYGQSPVTDGLIVHVAADEIPGVSNGDYIKTWRDLSGNGNDLFQNSNDLKPTYAENVVGGQPAVRFDGLNDMMNFTYEMTDIRTVFFVLKEDADAEDDWRPFLSHHLGDYDHWHRGELKAFWSVDWGRAVVYDGTTTINGEIVDGRDNAIAPAVIPTVHSIISHVTLGDVPADQIAHDRDASMNTRSWDGDMAEILIFNRVLSGGEADAVGYYLADKYGIDSTYEMLYAIRPQDGDDGVPVDVIFEWGAGSSSVTGFDVYLGQDPNNLELVSEGQAEMRFEPENNLEYESSYAWQVVAYEPNEISGFEEQIPGPVWRFTTRAEVPYIAEQPQDTWARVGETAEFRIVAESSSAMHYDWYRVVEGGDDVSFGVDSDVFELPNVQIADEGYYYCIVTNDSGSEQSEEAFLTAGRVIARWEFEDDFLDETGSGWDGVIVGGDPNFTQGVNGRAVEFLGDSNLYIEIPGSNDGLGFDIYLGYSLTAWVKTSQGGWGTVISKSTRESDTEPFEGIVLSHWEEWAAHQIRGVGDAWGWMPIFDEQWHFIAGTYDAQTGMVGVYVDGLFEEAIGPVYTFNITSEPFIIGNELTTTEPSSTSSPFEGQVDDLRVYNYPLPATEIGQRYSEYAGAFCLGNPEADLSGDCVVSIEDVAILAGGWLECNLFPDCVDTIE